MLIKHCVICVLIAFFLLIENVHAVDDIRYCGEPKRTASGKIKRSAAVLRDFEARYPLPVEYRRSDWQIDHVIPLAVGGCDALHNLQWLPKKIKTCSDDSCKDRWERIIYK